MQFFHAFAEKSEVLDKYWLIAFFILFFVFAANPRHEKVYVIFITIISLLVARLLITPILHFLYYQPHVTALSQIRLLVSEKSGWTFPNGHAAFLFSIATIVYLYNKKWGIGLFIITIFLNISRIITGIHPLPDMLVGMIVGTVTAYVIFYFVSKRNSQERTRLE